MKSAARFLSFLFHPLLMPTLGLLLILNSGTYLSLLDPAAKKAIIFVMALGTIFFPIMMLPILYYRNLITSLKDASREEKLISYLVILVLYVITFAYLGRLPLSRFVHAYVLSMPVLLFIILLIGLKFNICAHMAALGGMAGLIVTLILYYETPLQWVLIFSLTASGLTGTARLISGVQRPLEIYSGFLLGFVVVLATLLLY
ncbi:MAG: hypothetical protein V2B15_10745 [Bacteroidota bacterium]